MHWGLPVVDQRMGQEDFADSAGEHGFRFTEFGAREPLGAELDLATGDGNEFVGLDVRAKINAGFIAGRLHALQIDFQAVLEDEDAGGE